MQSNLQTVTVGKAAKKGFDKSRLGYKHPISCLSFITISNASFL